MKLLHTKAKTLLPPVLADTIFPHPAKNSKKRLMCRLKNRVSAYLYRKVYMFYFLLYRCECKTLERSTVPVRTKAILLRTSGTAFFYLRTCTHANIFFFPKQKQKNIQSIKRRIGKTQYRGCLKYLYLHCQNDVQTIKNGLYRRAHTLQRSKYRHFFQM